MSASQAKVLASGVQVISDPNLAPFVEAMQPVYKRFVNSEEMRNLVARIRAVQETK